MREEGLRAFKMLENKEPRYTSRARQSRKTNTD